MNRKVERRPPPRLCARGQPLMKDDPALRRIPAIVDAVVRSLEEEDSPDHIGFPMIPSRNSLLRIVELYLTILMPGYYGKQAVDPANARFYVGDRINRLYTLLEGQIRKCLVHECRETRPECSDCAVESSDLTLALLSRIPELRGILAGDIRAAYDGDPAAKSLEEIVFCYPGIFVVTLYRLAHELHGGGVPILPRMLTEHAHSETGCDIHPGARIGHPFFIDHCTGVVIGETAVIGRNVRIYQGVTLGGSNFRQDEEGRLVRDTKRHPTIEDDCVLYAGATILGGDTVVGTGSVIGGNVWLTHSVPPRTKVVADCREIHQTPIGKDES